MKGFPLVNNGPMGLPLAAVSGKIGAIADVHVGNHRAFGGETTAGVNGRCRQILQVLQAAVDKMKGGHLLILGDLFDTCRPSPQLVAAVMEVLSVPETTVWIVAGNHDKASEAPGDNALVPFKYLPNVHVVDSAPVFLQHLETKALILLGPYQAGPATFWVREYERCLDAVTGGGTTKWLATHVGLIHAATPPWLQNASDAVPAEDLKYNTLAGNWHQWWGTGDSPLECIQVGALVPTGFDNPSPWSSEEPYGNLVILRSDTSQRFAVEDVSELTGPRFYFANYLGGSGLPDQDLSALRERCRCHLRLRADLELVPQAEVLLHKLISEGHFVDGDVEPSAQDKEQKADAVRAATQSSASLYGAVDTFVQNMLLPTRKATQVAECAKEYIRKAQKQVGG